MRSSMLHLAFAVLLIVKATLGLIDCEIGPFESCERPRVFLEIPTEISEFNERCRELKSALRCTKDWQDKCGTDRLVLYPVEGLFEATYNTVSDICEEGTLLNSVAVENLKCFNETFGKTSCGKDADEFFEPLIKEVNENEESRPELSLFCLGETYRTDCVLRALSDNCGKLVEEAMLEVVRRSKSLEYACSEKGAQSVLDELDDLGLSEDKKKSFAILLEKLVGENRD